MNVGQIVARLRGERSQQWLADAMRARGWKWAQATTYNVEQGKRPLKFVEARDLAAVLGVDVMELYGDPETVTRQNKLRSQTDAVSDTYSAAKDSLGALILALQALSESLSRESASDERLTDDAQRAKAALKQTPNRALSEARKAHPAPVEKM